MVATLIMANPPKTRAERARLAAARLRSRASRPAGMSMLHKAAKPKSNPAKKKGSPPPEPNQNQTHRGAQDGSGCERASCAGEKDGEEVQKEGQA